ncbi:MAG: hypothetical protein AAGF23_06725, partial [Acidobacteriota bacterium]
MPTDRPELDRGAWLVPAAAAVLWSLVYWRNAWICDDAYITFRCVEQLHAGNGPQWNPVPRVQAFTHPLWFFVLSAVRAVSGAVWWNAMLTSFVFATGALAWVGTRLRGRAPSLALLLALALGSKAFVDFAAGGLENALVFALLAVFLAVLERSTKDEDGDGGDDEAGDGAGDLVRLTLVGALLLLCRHDLLFVIAPPIAAVAWRRRALGLRRIGLAVALGGLPFVAWTVFSLVYYGFPFPNTAYAKLNHGVDDLRIWRQGVFYFTNALRWDPLTLFVCIAGPAVLLESRRPSSVALGAGCFFHLFYVAKVGGDFMAGRFLTPVFFVGLATLAIASTAWSKRRLTSACAAAAATALLLPGARLFVDTSRGIESYYSKDRTEHGIADEKRVWSGRGGFRSVERRLQAASWTFHGEQVRRKGVPVVHTAVGWDGFHAGVEARII